MNSPTVYNQPLRTTSTTTDLPPQRVTNATYFDANLLPGQKVFDPAHPVSVTCNWNQFACRDRQQCVPKSAKCNNNYECRDYSDEDNCCEFVIYPGELTLYKSVTRKNVVKKTVAKFSKIC